MCSIIAKCRRYQIDDTLFPIEKMDVITTVHYLTVSKVVIHKTEEDYYRRQKERARIRKRYNR